MQMFRTIRAKMAHWFARRRTAPTSSGRAPNAEPIFGRSDTLLGLLYEISRILAEFESLTETFGAVLTVASRAIPIKTAVLIEDHDGKPTTSIWPMTLDSDEHMLRAKAYAYATYKRLIDASRAESAALEAAPTTFNTPISGKGGSSAQSPKPDNYVALPLAVSKEPIFGLLQVESKASFGEHDLTFLSALTNQLAVALSRSYVADALRQAKDVAESSNRAKSSFLSNMSHEIRTPLGAILGFTEFLLDPELPDQQRITFAATVRRNGELLLRLVDDILDVAKVEAGMLGVERITASLSQILKEVSELLFPKAQENGVALSVTAESGVPDEIMTDPMRLKQILINIIGNAIKFSKGGSVEVRLRMNRESDARPSRLEFLVKDSGRGIAPEQQLRLFRSFGQADSSITRQFGGTGLGLVLARRLAEALGGGVELVESEIGKGSTFAVSIDPGPTKNKGLFVGPFAMSSPPVAGGAARVSESLAGLHVLVVEDAIDSRVLIDHILAANGADVDQAKDGIDAVEKARSRDYDIILMDLEMPRQDGFEATAQLRRQGYQRPIIALTAHALSGEREHCLARGFNEHLTKPINRQRLLEYVARFCGRERLSSPPPA